MSGKVSTRVEHISKEMERDIDERTTAIWAWVREHRHSLCSERGYRMMREAIDAATESLRQQLAPLIEEIAKLKLKLSIAKDKAVAARDERDRTIKTLQKEAKATLAKYAEAVKELEELQAKAVEERCAVVIADGEVVGAGKVSDEDDEPADD